MVTAAVVAHSQYDSFFVGFRFSSRHRHNDKWFMLLIDCGKNGQPLLKCGVGSIEATHNYCVVVFVILFFRRLLSHHFPLTQLHLNVIYFSRFEHSYANKIQ